jgi:hypothetical protein
MPRWSDDQEPFTGIGTLTSRIHELLNDKIPLYLNSVINGMRASDGSEVATEVRLAKEVLCIWALSPPGSTGS